MNQEMEKTYIQIKKNWDAVAKPLDSMGKFEALVAKLGAIQGTEHPTCNKGIALILCADNGIVEEGISQSGQEVTRICADNIANYQTTVGIMAKRVGCTVCSIDLGVAIDSEQGSKKQDLSLLGNGYLKKASQEKAPINFSIRKGTRNFLKEPAMTLEETKQAIEIGKKLAKDSKASGYDVICIGEMGIGNTTSSAALAAALLKEKAETVTGRGAGLDDQKLAHKIQVVQQAIDQYELYDKDPLTQLSTVGGFDLAGMVGVYLGAREYHIPVILDGAISLVAALAAERMEPGTRDYLIPSHKSREPLCVKILEELDFSPVLDAGMALGEGTGAVLFLGNLQTAVDVYEKCVPFADSGVEQYQRFQ